VPLLAKTPSKLFFGSSKLSYLMKKEHVSGAYGLEGRPPLSGLLCSTAVFVAYRKAE